MCRRLPDLALGRKSLLQQLRRYGWYKRRGERVDFVPRIDPVLTIRRTRKLIALQINEVAAKRLTTPEPTAHCHDPALPFSRQVLDCHRLRHSLFVS
jgi:hypothetical protein